MNALVKRSALPARTRFNGSEAGVPRVRYNKMGYLHFSKKACEAFTVAHPDGGPRPPRELALVEFDEEEKTLTFTAIDKPPKGLTEEDCFPIRWIDYKGGTMNAEIAVKRLLNYVGFEYNEGIEFPIVSTNLEKHSIVVSLPKPANRTEDAEERDSQLAPAAAPNHAAADSASTPLVSYGPAHGSRDSAT